MGLLVFSCDEVVPAIRVLVLNTGSDKNARETTSYGKILKHPKLCGSAHMYESVHLNYACIVTGGSMKGADWQKDVAYFPVDKK